MFVKAAFVCLMVFSFLAGGCLQNFFPDSSNDKSTSASSSASSSDSQKSADSPASKTMTSAFSGTRPDVVEVPGPDGPFVEPPLKGRPEYVYLVVAASALDPWDLEAEFAKLQSFRQVPIGYPAVDQRLGKKGFMLVVGKFARAQWAKALAESLRSKSNLSVKVEQKPYEFDRLKPAANSHKGIKAGRIFAGLTGVDVPVLSSPGKDAPGAGFSLQDGSLVAILDEQWVGNRLWMEVEHGDHQQGFVYAGRVLVDANLFPAPGGSSAVLGVSLGCMDSHCRWDYWLVDRGFEKRRLLKSAGERMPHDFSHDGKWLAYTTFDPSILVTSTSETKTLELGPGISPSFSPDGKLLYFRGPGVKGQRDDVRVSPVASWKSKSTKYEVRQVLDFKGTPMYPRAISTVPPRVDFLDKGRLFTLFFRLGTKVAKKSVHRWGVIFTPDGKILEKAGIAISD